MYLICKKNSFYDYVVDITMLIMCIKQLSQKVAYMVKHERDNHITHTLINDNIYDVENAINIMCEI